MAKYVDGFVLVVPKDKTDEYRKMAEMGKDAWMKHGALEYMECVGEDLDPKVPEGMEDMPKQRLFPEMAGAQPDETVWFSFVVFESREHRDEVNAKVMEEMKQYEEEMKDQQMPFDMTKMAYGGFEALVSSD